jgi:hypothetical protein
MGSFVGESSVSITVSATEGSDTIAYSVTTGSLPGGLSLSNAVISGTPTMPAADTTTSFTMTATDDEGQTSTRAFAITVTFVYNIVNSLRFNDDDSAYLHWTPSSAGNRKKWTWSGWVKLGSVPTSATQMWGIFGETSGGQGIFLRTYPNSPKLDFACGNGNIVSNALYRDPAAWYHIVCVYDSTSSQMKMYVNGSQITDLDTNTQPSSNNEGAINNNIAHQIGRQGTLSRYFDGYLADVNFVDGQALAPTSFGEYNAVYNQWVPKKFTGAYGTNGFKLDFAENAVPGFHDSSSNDITITNHSSITHSTTQKKFGVSSFGLSGSNPGFTIPQSSSVSPTGSNDITYESWVYWPGSSQFASLWHQYQSDWMNPNLGIVNGTNKLQWANQTHGGSNLYNLYSNVGLTVNTWQHIACTVSNKVVTLFIDGVNVGSHTYPNGTWTPAGSVLNISKNQAGYIDQIRISNTIRYTSNFTPPTSAFVSDSNTALLLQSDYTLATSLGKDVSTNSNHWLPNNLRSSDQVIDTPQNNFATLNSIFPTIASSSNTSVAEGNLEYTYAAYPGDSIVPANMTMVGKSYCEVRVWGDIGIGILTSDTTPTNYGWLGEGSSSSMNYRGGAGTGYLYYSSGSSSSGKGSWANGDIIGVALDTDSRKVWFHKNGTWLWNGDPSAGTNHTDLIVGTGDMFFAVGMDSPGSCVYNFGQDHTFAGKKSKATTYSDGGGIGSFCYAVPTGFKALCTKNLPAPAVVPGENFNALTHTGDGATNRAITGVGFQPDFVWFKQRDGTQDHMSFDSVRGAGYRFKNNSNVSEAYHTTTLKSFDSDGFTVGDSPPINNNNSTYVSWNWKAGTSVSGTTAGAGTGKAYSGSINSASGFSIITYKGNGTAGHGIPHRLSKAPDFWVVKHRNASGGWMVGSSAFTDYTYWNSLDDSFAPYNSASNNRWYSEPDDSNVYIQTSAAVSELNTNDDDYLMYCWHSVPGYSKIGSYTANGSADGNFLWTGFTPKYVMFKDVTNANSWAVLDSARDPYNKVVRVLTPNSSDAVYNYNSGIDFVSNGIKIRDANGKWGDANVQYLFMAFAEYPFKYGNAR